MSRRAVLWIAFAVVHLGVAVLGFLLPNAPMGDVYLVYERWSGCALDLHRYCLDLGYASQQIVGITVPWVYPQLALVPMLATWLLAWAGGYTVAWAILVTLLDGLAFALLVGDGRSAGRQAAGWFWLAFAALLGPVGMYRLDGLTVPIVLVGCLWLVRLPWLGGALLTAAVWIKVWPAALLAAAFVALRRRVPLIGAGILVSAAVLSVVFVLGGGANAFGFVDDQTGRGLQVEAPVSAVYLWQAVAGVPGATVYYSQDLLTYQVTGAGVDTVIAVMTPLLVLVVGAVLVSGALATMRGASFAVLFPALAFALVLALIVVNKVGSPQYQSWLIVPLAMGLVLDRARWWRPATLALGVALLTQIVYPLVYFAIVVDLEPVPTLVLTARNVLLVVLFVWAVRLVVVSSSVRGGPEASVVRPTAAPARP